MQIPNYYWALLFVCETKPSSHLIKMQFVMIDCFIWMNQPFSMVTLTSSMARFDKSFNLISQSSPVPASFVEYTVRECSVASFPEVVCEPGHEGKEVSCCQQPLRKM